jgi:CRP-like cAMP-binding protein
LIHVKAGDRRKRYSEGMLEVVPEIRHPLAELSRIVAPPAGFEHPVLRLMPDRVQDLVRSHGQWRSLVGGVSAMGRGAVGFVTDGALAAVDCKTMAAVGLHGKGSMFGWETSLTSTSRPVRLLALIEARWIEIDGEALASLMGQTWIEHIFARHALDRLARLQAEAACNAVHQVPQRAANWIRRLHDIAGPELRTTQASLAEAMGVQRTSVNAAVKALERDGALCVSRGRLTVIDPARLRRFACGC